MQQSIGTHHFAEQSIYYVYNMHPKENQQSTVPGDSLPFHVFSNYYTVWRFFFLHQSIDTLTFYRVYERRNCVIVHIEPTDNNQIRFKNTNK